MAIMKGNKETNNKIKKKNKKKISIVKKEGI